MSTKNDYIVDMPNKSNEVLNAYISLRREIALLRSAHIKDLDFGHNQISVLYRLSLSDATMGELSDHTLSDKGSMTRTVSLLEKAGLVQRASDKNDRRVYIIKLTAKGRTYALQAQKVRNAIGDQLDKCLTVAERRQLTTLVDKISTSLSGSKNKN